MSRISSRNGLIKMKILIFQKRDLRKITKIEELLYELGMKFGKKRIKFAIFGQKMEIVLRLLM